MGKQNDWIQGYRVAVARKYGVVVAIIYDKVQFWSGRGQRTDGWVHKTYDEMSDETALTERQIRLAYEKLRALGVIETKVMKIGEVPTFHFRLCKNTNSETNETSVSGTNETSVSIETNKTSLSINTEPTTELSSFSFGGEKNNSPVVAKNTTLLEEIIKIVNPREKVTQERLRVLNGRMKDYTHDEIVASARAFSQSAWHRNNKQMSIDNLIAPSKFGRWYGQRDESTPVDGPPPRITEDDDGRHYYRGTLMTIYNRDELLAQQAREEAEWDAKVAARGTE